MFLKLNKAECKVVFTANQGMRGGKAIELKKTVDAAVKNCPTIKNVFVYKRTNNSFDIDKLKDVIVDDVKQRQNSILFYLNLKNIILKGIR